MKRIGVLATGMSEIKGLPGALQRLFGHDFFAITERRDKPFNSFTSDRIKSPTSAAPDNVLKVVQRVAAELDTANADFVVIVDDLELVNLARITPCSSTCGRPSAPTSQRCAPKTGASRRR